jgi:hypothetical protein
MRIILISISVIVSALAALLFIGWPSNQPKEYGVTWSSPYAWSLGIDTNKALGEVMDDLGVRRFRIPAYWTDIERKQGSYDFTIVQEQLDAIAKRNGKVMLAIGARLPRWPECWVPDFAKTVDLKTREAMQMAYLKATYDRFKDHPAISGWQVENEANFTFYVSCTGLTDELVAKEIRYVQEMERARSIKRPVYTTDSGELSLWLDYRREIDGLGISVYRTVTNPWLGIIRYWFLPPWFYTRKAILLGLSNKLFVSEFQMEPWSDYPLDQTKLEDQYKTLSIEQMRKNFAYAKQMDVPAIDFWGVEWWYWMKEKQGNTDFWNLAKQFFANSK